MNFFEEIKSEQGENYLLMKNENNCTNIIEENNNFDNFEILSILGEGGFGVVYKVRYKLDNRIYAIKKIKELEENLRPYLEREIKLLTELKHHHIIKYYGCIVDKQQYYLLFEYMENGSLTKYLSYFSNKKIKIPNDFVWNIFMQCISGLVYLHSKGIIHRDIKPDNLLLNKNMILKISDFGTSIKIEKNKDNAHTFVGSVKYRAPEIHSRGGEEIKYNEKVDIYSLGIVIKDFLPFLENQKDIELINLITLMTKNEPKERPNAEQIYNDVKKVYFTNYFYNTCMDSLIRCLYSLKPMTSFFLNMDSYSLLSSLKKSYIKCLEAFTDKNINSWFDSVDKMRLDLIERNPILETNKEIEPIILLIYLFNGLDKEMNKQILEENKDNNHFILNTEFDMSKNKNETKQNYINNFFKKHDSYISNNFMGLIKEIRLCKECNLKTYKFKSYFFITFDLAKIPLKKEDKEKNIYLEECFTFSKKEELFKDIMCCDCIKITSHSVYKFFYSSPLLLIIHIKNDFQNEVYLYLNEILDLKEHIEFQNLPTKFKLKGILKKKGEKYLSNINIENSWFSCESQNIEQINFKPTKETDESIMMLFYQSIT